MLLNTYLHFPNGKCREAFELYARVLGGKVENVMTYGEMPMDKPAPDKVKNQIAHARVAFGEQLLMGSDAPPEHAQPVSGFSVNVSVDDPKEAERI
jgi:PhnB protein